MKKRSRRRGNRHETLKDVVKVLSYFLLFPTVPGTPRSAMDMDEYARIKWMPAEEQMFSL